ncbi:ras-responsive element-binding protein 1-like isoform X1 [Stegodyphus dumicola]|uniref:ras-responsive element-binding protein 1-like isoform X1 n=2 Tax=Stegodyphus dumicola TaxID=202533 RepID=UPI0015AA0517|nr:ras-responsive element-binding protein 1-like isoform X1 [Stegodyphus dumicola]
MSRRRRRPVRNKEKLPPKVQLLTRKLRSSKKVLSIKKATAFKATNKAKFSVKKSPKSKSSSVTKTEKINGVLQVPDKTLPAMVEQGQQHDVKNTGEEETKCAVNDLSIKEASSLLPETEEKEEGMEVAENIDENKIDTPLQIDESLPVDEKSETTDCNHEIENQEVPEESFTENSPKSPNSSVENMEIVQNIEEETNVSNAQNMCTVCNIVTDSSASLTLHMKQHSVTNNQIHKCLICLKSLSSASSLDRHMLVHSGERPFKCKLCDMSFTTNGNMHRHMRTHGEFDASDSTKSLDLRKKDVAKGKTDEDMGDESKPSEEKLHCPVCGKTFLCDLGLQSHMETHPNDPIRCQKCEIISVNYSAHTDHKCNILECKLPVKCYPFPCGFQELNFMDFTADKFSLVSKSFCEQNIKRPSSAFHVFECSECKKAFPCGRALKLHQRVHETKVGTFCPSCQCDFAAASFLQLHQLKHRSPEHCLNNSFSGEVVHDAQNHSSHAGKEDFLALLNLQTKQSQLSFIKGLKSYPVKEDNFENFDYFVHGKVSNKETKVGDADASNNNNNNDFADIQSIISLTSKAPLISAAQTSPVAVRPVSPLSVPSSQQPKSPEIAESANASPDTPSKEVVCIDNHDVPDINSTSDAHGLYSCKICSQKFKNISTLKRHCKLHMQRGSNYSCHLCTYASVDKSTLIRHLRTHNGERPFQCVICKYAFTTKANCERHVRKRHKKFGKAEIRNAMQYNPNMSLRGTDPSTSDISNSETVCKYCGVDFKFNRVLRHHLRSLHNSCNRKPFSCKICKFGFSTKNNCIRHVLKQHPNLKDKLRSVVIPNSQMSQIPNAELTSGTDNSNSSSVNHSACEQVQPLDLHCDNSDKPLDLQTEKNSYEFNANETVIAAESLVSLSNAPPLQEEPLDLAAHPLDLTCKPLSAVTKKLDSRPSSIFNRPSYMNKASSFVDLTTSKSITVPENKIQISPLPMTNNNNCSKKPESIVPNETPANSSGQKHRSFTCVYCCAGFTLKSNMERHIKRKHPEFARPTRSRNFIPSIVSSNLQKQSPSTLSDKTRDALRHVLSSKVQQMPIYKNLNSGPFPKMGNTFKIVSSPHNFITPVASIPGAKSTVNVSLDLSGKPKKITVVDMNASNVLKLSENNDEACSDLASVSSVICTANSPQFKQYLEKSSDLEKMEVNQKDDVKVTSEEVSSVKKSDMPSVSCPFCERKFPWTSSLRRHILTHTGQKPYKCPKCSLWFTTKSNCERHLIRKHGHKGDLITRSVPDRPYKCNHCLTSTFSTQGNLRKHFYLKHWTKSYLGMNCKPIQSDKKNDASISVSTLENKLDVPSISTVTAQEHSYSQPERKHKFPCHFCDDSFKNMVDLSNHMLKHPSVIYMCYLCRKTFPTHTTCYSHFKTSHSLVYMQITQNENISVSAEDNNNDEIPEIAADEKSISSVACMVCFQKMPSVEGLQQHFKKHLLKEKVSSNQEQAVSKETVLSSTETQITSSGLSEPASLPLANKRGRPTKNKVKNSLLYLFTPPSSCNAQKATRSSNSKMEIVSPEEDSDLIQNLLGIHDSRMIDEMLVSADSAARLLGVKEL